MAIVDLKNMYSMDSLKLRYIISNFQMPKGNYVIVHERDEFGESEFYWIIENEDSKKRFLLVCSYWHPSKKDEIRFYEKHGFTIKNVILRKYSETFNNKKKRDTDAEYLLGDMYAIFEI